MGAQTTEGTGHGSAAGQLRGFTLDKLHHVLRPIGVGSSIRQTSNGIQLVDTATDAATDIVSDAINDSGLIAPPIITSIDSKLGIVYLENPSGLQIEVYKYTRRQKSDHTRADEEYEYTPRKGKRYKPHVMLPYEATTWTMPERWIAPMLANDNSDPDRRHYFKFGVRTLDGVRSNLTTLTVCTAVNKEYDGGNGIKILLQGPGGGGNPG
jgi:hypothetical protein